MGDGTIEASSNLAVLNEKLKGFNETQESLGIAWNLLQSIKKSGNKEMYDKFSKNYENLYNNINKAISDDKNISSKERDEIKNELAGLLILAKNNSIDYIGDIKDSKDISSLMDKKIDNLNTSEALIALEYINKNFILGNKNLTTKNDTTNNNMILASGMIISSQIQPIVSLKDVSKENYTLITTKLKNKALGLKEGESKDYGNGLICSSDEKKGIVFTETQKIKNDFSSGNLENINKKDLIIYLNYLQSQKQLNPDYILEQDSKLLMSLGNYINKNGNEDVKKIFLDNLGKKFVDTISNIGSTEKISGYINNVFQKAIQTTDYEKNKKFLEESLFFKENEIATKIIHKCKDQIVSEISQTLDIEIDKKIKSLPENKKEEKTKELLEGKKIVINYLSSELENKDIDLSKIIKTTRGFLDKGKIDSSLMNKTDYLRQQVILNYQKAEEENRNLETRRDTLARILSQGKNPEAQKEYDELVIKIAHFNEEKNEKKWRYDLINSATDEQLEDLLNKKTTLAEIEEENLKVNKGLRYNLNVYKENKKNIYIEKEKLGITSDKENKKTDDEDNGKKTLNNNEHNNLNTKFNDPSFIKDFNNGGYTLKEGNVSISTSRYERRLCKEPGYKKNFINAYSFINEAGGNNLWGMRNDVFFIMDNLNLTNSALRSPGSRMDKRDTTAYLSIILKSIGIEPKKNLDEISKQIKEINEDNNFIKDKKSNDTNLFAMFKKTYCEKGPLDKDKLLFTLEKTDLKSTFIKNF